MALHVAEQLETRLEAAAKEHSVDTSSFVNELLEQALDAQYPVRKPQPSAKETMEMFRELAMTATNPRNYPEDFFSRDVIYEDHD